MASLNAPTAIPTLSEYWDRCAVADWFYSFSDDPYVARRGRAEIERLQIIAKGGTVSYMIIFTGFQRHYFSGEPWKNEKVPKPPKPKTV